MKQLTIMGEVWDYTPSLQAFDKAFEESTYISFYKPWLQGHLDENKIHQFHEKCKNPILWPYKLLKRTCKLYFFVKKYHPDFIITHHDEANFSILPLLLLFRLKKNRPKFIGFIRAGKANYEDNNWYTNFKLPFIKLFYHFFDILFTPSRGNAEELRTIFKLSNLEYLYNPADEESYKKRALEKLTVQEKKYYPKTFVTIGRLTQQKGHWYLIRIFSEIVKKHSNVKLIIIGDGELREETQNFINRLNLQNNIFLIGKQKNVYKFINHADAFLLPSLWESFGNVLVESLALNKIVVTADCKSGPREVIAPELKVKERIKYPYYAPYGILMKPFHSTKVEWISTEKKPLCEEEKAWIKIIENILFPVNSDKALQKKYAYVIKRLDDFSIPTIAKEIRRKI